GTAGDRPCVTELFSGEAASEHGVQFAGPKGIAVASDGNVYVAGTGAQVVSNDNIVRISPDGTITEIVSAQADLGKPDWNPSGIAIDENAGAGTYVYAAGPSGGGFTVRVAPDGTAQDILDFQGQGVALDEQGTLYVAGINTNTVYQIPDARHGICGQDGKDCPALIKQAPEPDQADEDSELDCDGQPIVLTEPYALALGGGILYVTGQRSANVLRRPIRPDHVLNLPTW